MSTPPPIHDISALRQRLVKVEARVRRRNLLSLNLWLKGGVALTFAVLFVCDFLTHFPAPVRVILTLATFGVFAVWLPLRYRRIWSCEDDVGRLARRIEREVAARLPGGYGSLLVSGLEFGSLPETSGSAVLKDRVIQQSLGDACDPLKVDLHDHQLQRRGLRLFGLAVVVYVLWVGISPTTFSVFVRRAVGMGVEYPTRTRIMQVDYPRVVKVDTDIVVSVKAAGELPGGGVLRVNYDDSVSFELPLEASESRSEFLAVIKAPTRSLTMRVRLGDADSHGHQIRVVPPPAAIDGTLSVSAPAYTGIADRAYTLSNVSVPHGGALSLHVRTDRPVAICEFLSNGESRPMTASDGAYTLTGLVVNEALSYSIRLVDADGIENTDRLTYRVSVIADQTPTIRLTRPDNESYWAPVSSVRWETRLSDDYGLAAARMRLQIAEQTEEGDDIIRETITRDISLPSGQTEATLEGILMLADTPVRAGQILLLSVQARDAGPTSEADSEDLWHSSETLRLHIVTPSELREIIIAEEQIAYKQIGDVTDDVKHQIRMLHMQEQLSKERP